MQRQLILNRYILVFTPTSIFFIVVYNILSNHTNKLTVYYCLLQQIIARLFCQENKEYYCTQNFQYTISIEIFFTTRNSIHRIILYFRFFWYPASNPIFSQQKYQNKKYSSFLYLMDIYVIFLAYNRVSLKRALSCICTTKYTKFFGIYTGILVKTHLENHFVCIYMGTNSQIVIGESIFICSRSFLKILLEAFFNRDRFI
eukprot:TRINITY_DN15850_c0_g1_i1.p2 TRINITY_DN15850_c0_g1~~TRINITY_DN15850_c0_g1_i1.p2  ORF type:complete len:201 (-),score=-23.27 TRINITY_DN15850_c0_g1_i1:302-904(-)